ncbi:hypothetical protein AXF42_Ash006187 [Apostasia shenzhenica]|uniref:Uncharacterized protein n=1 Tax=Apostasia shenzhenica TaxID=1088818 RepID=A0A2I0B0H2_9ASPA|nr:hypothetical protein AXF42_Ash006187 [Apostasia shenzhenica]
MWGSDAEDFSPAATIIPFDPPIPILRGPFPACPSDNPSKGPFVLTFRDAASWRLAYRATESKIIEQCEAAARSGCSISVSNKCKPPWWKLIFGAKAADFAEREECEAREMTSCLAAAKEACIGFARERCAPPFQEARIATSSWKGSSNLVFWTSEKGFDAEYSEADSSACSDGASIL